MPTTFDVWMLPKMQLRFFTIPIVGGEHANEEMNSFLRSKRILQVESQFASNGERSFWCFCVKYLPDDLPAAGHKKKIDYRETLDSIVFQRFVAMRETRKKIAQEEGLPAYAIFTDAELAELAKVSHLTWESMRSVQGIGPGRLEKYGSHFIVHEEHEKSWQAD